MAETDFIKFIIDNWYLYAIVFFSALVIFWLYKRRTGKDEITFKEFKPQKLKKTFDEGISEKVKLLSRDFNGKLFVGFYSIAKISRYFYAKGFFELVNWDDSNKAFRVSTKKDENKKYHLLVLEARSNNFILSILGLDKKYFILKYKDEKGKYKIRFDPSNKNIILPEGADLTSYGNIWTNCMDGIEYLDDVSIKRMSEQIRMHLENWPDKLVHLEMELAKRERILKSSAESDKLRFKERAEAGDTTLM